MRKICLPLLILMFAAITNAQVAITVTGNTNTVPNLAASYLSLANAISGLSGITAISGPVTLTCASSGTETAPVGGYSISFSANTTSANNVVIEGSASTITAPTSQTSGNLNDAIFKIIGCDYVTIRGFTMLENVSNTTTTEGTNNMTEWGVALLYVSTTNGAQNCTIQNNSITLNRTYQNTFGIYSNSTHSATAVTTAATATTTGGGNSGLKIYSNNISNVNNGIVVVGPTAFADINDGVDIGGASGSTANTLSNYGTTGTFSAYANVSATVYGILVRNSKTINVSYNSITSSAGGVTSGTLRGIYIPSFSGGATGTFTNAINNNTISLTGGVASGILQCITVETTTGTSTATLNINNNNFTAATFAVASSAAVTLISDAMANRTSTINGNTFTNITTNTTGGVTFISHDFAIPSAGSLSIDGNSIITAFNKTGAGGFVILTAAGPFSSTGSLHNYTNNNFSNITVTGTSITGFSNTSFNSAAMTITGNTFNNWASGTGSITAMTFIDWGGVSSLSGNTITNITGQSSIVGINIGSLLNAATSISISSNTISNLSSTGSGGGVIGITCSNSSLLVNINGNTINTFSSTGTFSTVLGISINGATTTNVFQNTIHGLSGSSASSPVCNGISVSSGATVNVYKNKIYNLLESGAFTASSPVVNGILLSGGTTVTTYNNLIGDLKATAVSSTDAIRGIGVTSALAASTQNVYNNSVYLNASTSGTNFGTTGIFHTASATATAASLNLRNNIIVNNCTQKGTGLVVALRRSSGAAGTLANYAGASNNNLFYAGTPGAGNLIYSDGTGNAQTLAAYKAAVFTAGTIAQRDASSVTENPPFLSTTGSSPNFLHIDPSIATQVESAGANIAIFTDDYDGDTRNAATPDIGADEGTFILTDVTGPAISYTTLSNTLCLTAPSLNVIIIDAIGVNTIAGTKPRLWYRKGSNANSLPATNDNTTNGWKYVEASNSSTPFSFTIDYSLLNGGVPVVGDVIHYFVVAQDLNITPNLSINAGLFTTVPSIVALNAGAFPVSGNNTYTLLTPVATSVTIGAAGTFTSLTGAGGLFAAMNAGGLIGNTTVTILDAAITETGAFALNSIYTCGGPYALNIVPNTGVAAVLAGSNVGPLIDLNGADNVTIDGLNTGGSSLTISNTATGASSTVRFIADASNNIITNSTIQGSASSGTTGVVFFSTGTSTGNDNNNINNCNITAAGANLPIFCLYASGTSVAIANNGNTVTANNISDYFHATTRSAGITIDNPGNTAWTITNNRLFQTATRLYTGTASHQGINILVGSGYTITGNIIGFANAGGTGTTNMVGNSVPLTGTFPGAYTVTGTPASIRYIGIHAAFTSGGTVSNVSGNTIAGFAFFTSRSDYTDGGIWCGIYIFSGNANVGTSSGNIIGATSGTGSVYTACTSSGGGVVGIFANSFNTVTIQNNIIGAIDAMGTTVSVSGSITGINTGNLSAPAPGIFNISGNTIGNATNPNLRMGNLTTGGNLSNTGTTFSAASGVSYFYGILNYESGTIVIGTSAMPNIIRNVYQNSTSSSTFARCLYNDGGASVTISGNTVTEISSNSTNTAFGDAPAILGIKAGGGTSGQTIELNTLSALKAVNTGANNTNVIGIIFFGGSGNARRNNIFDLTNINTGTLQEILGMWVWPQGASTSWTLSNNMISLTNAPYTNPVQVVGIYDIGTAVEANYYFNSVNIGGSASGGAIGSFSFWRTGITPNSHRNNIYTNTRTGGSAIHYSIRNSYSTPASGWSAAASDNNVLNNAGSVIGRWGTTDVDFAGWKSNSLGDNNSKSGIPLTFANAAAGDLHFNMGVTPTPIESGGVAIPGITIDYDNQTRPGPLGSVNGGAYAPDIGADEFDGVPSATPLVNDDAPGAILLTVNAGCSGAAYNNNGATKSANEVYPSCSGIAETPVWFKFVAPASGAVRITTDAGTGATFNDSKVGLFSASNVNDYSTFSIISCDDDGGSFPGYEYMSFVYATGLTPGNTYYIAVDKYDNLVTNGTYCIEVHELNSSMLATANTCPSTYQAPFGSNASYAGWQPLLDANSSLIALVKNPAGGAVNSYSVSQNIVPGNPAPRTDATSGEKYLNRNFMINNSAGATNVEVQFFFLNSELTALQTADPSTTLADIGVTRQTGSVCQNDFITAIGTNSHLSQLSNGTVNGISWASFITPGFSNFYLHSTRSPLLSKVYLEGAYNAVTGPLQLSPRHKNVTAAWAAALNANALSQPYNVAAFENYNGGETVTVGFFTSNNGALDTTDIIDWVLLEVRDAALTLVERRAAFVREDGMIVDLDGTSSVSFPGLASDNYYITIRHRNHLGISTQNLIVLTAKSLGVAPSGTTDFDFRTQPDANIYGDALAYKIIGGNNVMVAGNANSNNAVRFTGLNNDAAALLAALSGNQAAVLNSVYNVSDINLDGTLRFTGLNNDAAALLAALTGNQAAVINEQKR